jgi:tRNA(fMet)-specific endonuclease VapC
MTKEPLTITLEPDSVLARALADADVAVILETNGVRYFVSRENVFARYDAQAALRGLRQSRGALKGVNLEELLTDLDELRSQDPSRHSV